MTEKRFFLSKFFTESLIIWDYQYCTDELSIKSLLRVQAPTNKRKKAFFKNKIGEKISKFFQIFFQFFEKIQRVAVCIFFGKK